MTTTNWDYTRLAPAYADRPDYAPEAVDAILRLTGAASEDLACDIGAGSGHLTLPLLERELRVDAVEPNAEMRALGVGRTAAHPSVRWFDGTAECTGRASGRYRLVTFGSSFNVADPSLTLPETARILTDGGWFACVWNHRDVTDPLQSAIEELIVERVPGYSYGSRRADQSTVIDASGLFGQVHALEHQVVHEVDVETWCAAWRSHATLARQAGDDFDAVVDAIGRLVRAGGAVRMDIPYVTRGWTAQVLSKADRP
ncbi:class I SAM-dependent methyltransferase [Streptomyces sp. NPDC050617]|uniref:class I SAM-dependent methyltransferase n=1 Tax=Streptomyces sp. NPDC050617 TaxID=3154628 RepID=UPI00344204A7